MGTNSFWSPSRTTIGRNWFTSGSFRSFQKEQVWKYFLYYLKKMYSVHERTKGRPKLLFLYLFNLFSFTIAYFHLYYLGIFPLSTGLVRTFYDYMRYPVHLWLTYGSLVTHLGKLV